MQRLRTALTCALLVAIIGLVVQVILLLNAATQAARALPETVCREFEGTRAALIEQIGLTRQDLAAQVDGARKDALGQITALRTDVMGEVAEIRTTADRRVGDALARVDTALGQVEEVRGDFQPILQHAAGVTKQVDDAAPLFLDCEYNPDCVFNRYVGAAQGVERAARDLSAMTHDFRGALPRTLAGFDHIISNSDRTTASTAQVMDNFARATKPLPAWIRIPLGVTGAIAPTAAGAIGAAAAAGALR